MSAAKIGVHLKEARKTAGLSSGSAAKKAGITGMSLSRYENDHRLPDAGVLLALARAYGCDLNSLVTGAVGERPAAVPVRGKVMDRTKFELDLSKGPQDLLPIMCDRPGAFAVRVVGSGMQPTAYHDEYLILEKPAPQKFLEVTRGDSPELVRGESIGKLLGVFRKA